MCWGAAMKAILLQREKGFASRRLPLARCRTLHWPWDEPWGWQGCSVPPMPSPVLPLMIIGDDVSGAELGAAVGFVAAAGSEL